MTSYRVCFFNEIPRNDRLFKCCQRSIVIRAGARPNGQSKPRKSASPD
jgi:hypothetical protein